MVSNLVRVLLSLVVGEMWVKIIIRYYYVFVRMVKIKRIVLVLLRRDSI